MTDTAKKLSDITRALRTAAAIRDNHGRVRQTGPNKQGARESHRVYRLAGETAQ
jgi:hypothetical protein